MFVILAVGVMVAVWVWWTYPRVGSVLFTVIAAVESRRARLKDVRVPIARMTMATYQGGSNRDRPPLLLIHGFSADKGVWFGFARHFTRDFRVIVPDLAGHGQTPFERGGDYSIAAQAQRMIELLDACGIEQVHVVGSSMGAYVGTWLAVHFPGRVLSLALIGPVGVHLPQPNEVEALVNSGDNPFLIHTRAQFDRFFAMTMASPPWIPGVLLAAEAQSYIERRLELEEIFADFSGSPRLELWLKDVNIPTLLLWGREDRMVPVASARTWIEGIPHAQWVCWDGVGHLPMVERPDEAAALYREFLG